MAYLYNCKDRKPYLSSDLIEQFVYNIAEMRSVAPPYHACKVLTPANKLLVCFGTVPVTDDFLFSLVDIVRLIATM